MSVISHTCAFLPMFNQNFYCDTGHVYFSLCPSSRASENLYFWTEHNRNSKQGVSLLVAPHNVTKSWRTQVGCPLQLPMSLSPLCTGESFIEAFS